MRQYTPMCLRLIKAHIKIPGIIHRIKSLMQKNLINQKRNIQRINLKVIKKEKLQQAQKVNLNPNRRKRVDDRNKYKILRRDGIKLCLFFYNNCT